MKKANGPNCTHARAAAGLGIEAARELERVCDEFEASWRTGQRPLIEVAIGNLSEPVRSAATRELVKLDAYYRERVVEKPSAGDCK